jgi:hypothetical protein
VEMEQKAATKGVMFGAIHPHVQEDPLGVAAQQIEEASGDVLAVQIKVTGHWKVEKWVEEIVEQIWMTWRYRKPCGSCCKDHWYHSG